MDILIDSFYTLPFELSRTNFYIAYAFLENMQFSSL